MNIFDDIEQSVDIEELVEIINTASKRIVTINEDLIKSIKK